MAFLLDTSVAVDLRDERAPTLDLIAALPAPYAFSLMTLVELEGGVAAHPDLREHRRRAVDRLLSTATVVPFDDDVLNAYRHILTQAGFSRPRILDRLIAATAIVHDLTLITTKGADFVNIPGLKLQVWPSPAQ